MCKTFGLGADLCTEVGSESLASALVIALTLFSEGNPVAKGSTTMFTERDVLITYLFD